MLRRYNGLAAGPLLLIGITTLPAASAAAWTVRRLVGAEQISDQTSLLLSGATVLFLLWAAAFGVRGFVVSRLWRQRAAFGVLSIGFAAVLTMFVAASMEDASVEMEAIVEAEQPTPAPSTLVLGPGGLDVRLTGELQEGMARRLEALLDAYPEVTRIHLTSEGGLADEGQALGDVIAAHKLSTFVPDYCVSACTLAFVRGRERLILADSRVGFHAPYEQGLFGTMYRDNGDDQRISYRAAGISAGFVDAALKVDPANIWYPTPPQLAAAHVITGVIDRFRLPDSELDGLATLAGARDLALRNFPLLAAFDVRLPHAVDRIAAWYLKSYQQARSEGEDERALKVVVKSAVALALNQADDPTLVSLAQLLEHALAAETSDATCTAISNGDLTAAVHSSEDISTSAVALLRRALASHERPLPGTTALPTVSAAYRSNNVRSCAEQAAAMGQLLASAPVNVATVLRSRISGEKNSELAALQDVLRKDD